MLGVELERSFCSDLSRSSAQALEIVERTTMHIGACRGERLGTAVLASTALGLPLRVEVALPVTLSNSASVGVILGIVAELR